MNNAILPYPEVKSTNNECKRLVVLLHGLGSDGHDLIGLVPFLAPELPDCHFIAPHAVEAFESGPYGRQWFSIRLLAEFASAREFVGDTERRTGAYSSVREDSSTGSTHKLPAEVELYKKSIHSCTPHILANNIKLLENIIQEKQAQLNLTNKETIIIGFSQGTMIGLYLTFLQHEPFYATIGFSGRLIQPPKCINKITPICLVHGELDDIVDVNNMEEIIKYLQQHSISYRSYRVPDLMHTIDSRGLTFALKFIKEY